MIASRNPSSQTMKQYFKRETEFSILSLTLLRTMASAYLRQDWNEYFECE